MIKKVPELFSRIKIMLQVNNDKYDIRYSLPIHRVQVMD